MIQDIMDQCNNCRCNYDRKNVKTATDWVHYDDAAIDVKYELPKFIKILERSYQALGSKTKVIYPHEHHKYDFKK